MKKKQGLHNTTRFEALWLPRKEETEWLYLEQKWPMSKIGSYFGYSQTGMSKVMRRLGIQPRGKGRAGKENGRYKDGSQSRQYRQMIEKDKCFACGSIKGLGIHHKNGDHFDNHLENLQVLCDSCHNSYHKKLWWKKNREKIDNAKRNKKGQFEEW